LPAARNSVKRAAKIKNADLTEIGGGWSGLGTSANKQFGIFNKGESVGAAPLAPRQRERLNSDSGW
jgi:hypothetical protein